MTSAVFKSTLIATVVAIKVLEWWYLVAERRLERRLPHPVPPPPPPPKVENSGRLLLGSVGCCPLCGKQYEMAT